MKSHLPFSKQSENRSFRLSFSPKTMLLQHGAWMNILQYRGEQIVIPIFYGIDPSVVRKQSGSYADAFVQREERFKDKKEDKVLAWRAALKTAADISGFDSQTMRPESDLVKVVVNDIWRNSIANCKSHGV